VCRRNIRPKTLKDAESYLVPFEDECVELAIGVPTYNAVTRQVFTLRGYNLFGLGDIIALEKIMNIKGHNGFCPCRSCEIKGARNIAGHEKIYYVPLTHPDGRVWVAERLPKRTHESFYKITEDIA
jgi:hypothetical protein